jgi:uncharacterized tellurite resistance protein B-like protein
MLNSIIKFVSELTDSGKEASRFEENDYRLSAAALLVHAATIDGTVSDTERERLCGLIKQRFELDDASAKELIEAATNAERNAIDLYSFTSLLNRTMDDAGRQHVVEMMWEIVFADGRVSEFEDNLLWRAADLLHVPSRERIALRRRAAEKYAVPGARGSD